MLVAPVKAAARKHLRTLLWGGGAVAALALHPTRDGLQRVGLTAVIVLVVEHGLGGVRGEIARGNVAIARCLHYAHWARTGAPSCDHPLACACAGGA